MKDLILTKPIIKVCLIAVCTAFIANVPLKIYAGTIQFSGIIWDVKSGSNLGPGPNYWSSNSQNVWVDTNGYLHMKIRNVNGIWYCSELTTQKSFGYGEYSVCVEGNLESYDKNTVLGIFTYETDTREIDIEFSRWANMSNPAGWYTVQPVRSTSQRSFALNLKSNLSTHKFTWASNAINFQSYNGTSVSDESLIENWTYSGSQNPPAGNELFHLNFWLFQGRAPSNGLDAEVVIRSVTIANCTFTEVLNPTAINSAGAQWNIDGGKWMNSGEKIYVTAGNHTINFKSVSGYDTPSSKTITIAEHADLKDTTTYSLSNGINNISTSRLKVYPIPCHDKLYVKSNLSDEVDMTIMDILGKLVISKRITLINDNPFTVNEISTLEKGFYLLKLHFSSTDYMQEFIKN
jgi:hypothetical protein